MPRGARVNSPASQLAHLGLLGPDHPFAWYSTIMSVAGPGYRHQNDVGVAWGSASFCIYVPVFFHRAYSIQSFGWMTTAALSVSCALYDANATTLAPDSRLHTEASASAANWNRVTITAFNVEPGLYYIGTTVGATTAADHALDPEMVTNAANAKFWGEAGTWYEAVATLPASAAATQAGTATSLPVAPVRFVERGAPV